MEALLSAASAAWSWAAEATRSGRGHGGARRPPEGALPPHPCGHGPAEMAPVSWTVALCKSLPKTGGGGWGRDKPTVLASSALTPGKCSSNQWLLIKFGQGREGKKDDPFSHPNLSPPVYLLPAHPIRQGFSDSRNREPPPPPQKTLLDVFLPVTVPNQAWAKPALPQAPACLLWLEYLQITPLRRDTAGTTNWKPLYSTTLAVLGDGASPVGPVVLRHCLGFSGNPASSWGGRDWAPPPPSSSVFPPFRKAQPAVPTGRVINSPVLPPTLFLSSYLGNCSFIHSSVHSEASEKGTIS